MFGRSVVSGRRAWLFCLLIVVLCAVAGCGGGSGGSGGGTTDRSALLDAASAKWDGISHADPGAASTEMVDWLRTQPAVVEAGVTNDLIVYARLTDGTTAGWLDNAYLNGAGRAAAAPVAAPPTGRAIPTGKTAYLFQSDLFTLDAQRPGSDIRPQMASILRQAGYTVVEGKGTFAEYRAISPTDCALLWTNSHGTLWEVEVGGERQTHYYMASSTSPSTSDNKPGGRYYDDLRTGRLITLKNPGQPYFFWFSGAWLQNNVRFPLGGFAVWINNACEGVTTPEMKDAAFHQGLSAYVAWDESVLWGIANQAALTLVDRMTGANAVDPTMTPAQRAFGLNAVVDEMGKRSPPLTVSTVEIPWYFKYLLPGRNSATAHLRVATNPFAGQPTDQQFSILTPSIQNLAVDQTADNETTLTINGIFGPIPGTVTIDGRTATVASGGWGPSTIRCLLPPANQPGGAGNVVVEVGGHRSNPVPLTAWKLSIHTETDARYSGTVLLIPGEGGPDVFGDQSGSTHTEADLEVWIRADVHTYRTSPGQTTLNSVFRNFFTTHNARKTRDVRVTGWDAGGTVTTLVHYAGQAPYDTWTDTLSATGATPVLFDGSDPRGLPTNLSGSVDPAAHTMKLTPVLVAQPLFRNVHATVGPPPTTSDNFRGVTVSYGSSGLDVALGTDFGVTPGSRTEPIDNPSAGVTGTTTIRWTGQVFHAPDAVTARSVRVRR